MKPPDEVANWKAIFKEFENLWNFPHCIEAIDGKHVAIECFKLSGTQYFNYKGFFTVVLLAICDAKYRFTYIDFGHDGSTNNSSVLKSSGLYKLFEENQFNVPAPTEAEGFEDPLPYFLLGHEISPLKTWLMRPFPESLDQSKKIFSYRLSRARRTIENAFGILVARWRIFKRPRRASIETVQSVIGACVCLHNYLETTQSSSYTPQGFTEVEIFDGAIKEGDWKNIIKP